MAETHQDVLALLPHGPPFRFVSRITRLAERESGEGLWIVSGDESFFAGHFPGDPIVPGVLIGEALAQLSGVVGFAPLPKKGVRLSSSERIVPVEGKLVHIDLRFPDTVSPSAEIRLRSRLTRGLGAISEYEVEARVGDRTVASGSLALAATGFSRKRPREDSA